MEAAALQAHHRHHRAPTSITLRNEATEYRHRPRDRQSRYVARSRVSSPIGRRTPRARCIPWSASKTLNVADDETGALSAAERVQAPAPSARRARRACIGGSRAMRTLWRTERRYELMPDDRRLHRPHHADDAAHRSTPACVKASSSPSHGKTSTSSTQTISVLASHSKGNTTRTIPLNPEALSVLTTIKPSPLRPRFPFSPITSEPLQQHQGGLGRGHQGRQAARSALA